MEPDVPDPQRSPADRAKLEKLETTLTFSRSVLCRVDYCTGGTTIPLIRLSHDPAIHASATTHPIFRTLCQQLTSPSTLTGG